MCGLAAFMLIAGAFFLVYLFLYKKDVAGEWDRVIAYIFLLLAAATICAFHHLSWFDNQVPGGLSGLLLNQLFHRWFDRIGTMIIIYTMMAASLVIITRFSLITGMFFVYKQCIRTKPYYIIYALMYGLVNRITKMVRPAKTAIASFWIKKYFPAQQDKHSPLYDLDFWHNLTVSEKPQTPQHSSVSPVAESVASAMADMSPTAMPEPITDYTYQLPDMDLFIGVDEEVNDQALIQELEKRAVVLQEKLERFDVFGKVTAIKRGPIVTLFEYQPHIDTKISKIIALEDDLALALQATSIRIIAPIPGKSVVGFEVANKHRRNVLFSSLIKEDAYKEAAAALPMILGVDTVGAPVVIDLCKNASSFGCRIDGIW